MGSWRNHVLAQLQQRDLKEKLPFVGVFSSLSRLEEHFEVRTQILDDVYRKRGGIDVESNNRLLLQLRESEHLANKLSQTVSDLTSILYLKDAELQHWQSRVSQYRREALTLTKESHNLKANLSEFEFTIESQSKDIQALRSEQKRLKEALAQAQEDGERLMERWIQGRREEADRLNKYNDTHERWQKVAKHLKKQLQREKGKERVSAARRSLKVGRETPSSVIQVTVDPLDIHKGLQPHLSCSKSLTSLQECGESPL
ncbi:autophagy-related protein 16 isoform X2 [Oryzias melastigma]|uniref:autophagy-related protein 16 isoform X2 n=1 Tax=Oryzias melastigma TaxID=30732 RepID=UPI000CF82D96|nr:autophagy-related protein 16 isoform X2 [Oryzias melastigma]